MFCIVYDFGGCIFHLHDDYCLPLMLNYFACVIFYSLSFWLSVCQESRVSHNCCYCMLFFRLLVPNLHFTIPQRMLVIRCYFLPSFCMLSWMYSAGNMYHSCYSSGKKAVLA